MTHLTDAFLRTLYAPALSDPELGDATITLWTLPDKKSEHVPLRDIATIAERAKTLDDTGRDVYFGVALRYPNLTQSQRGTKNDLVAATALWLDIDLQSPGAHAATNLPANVDEAQAIFDAIGEPTLLVHSGHGLHAYYVLSEPMPLLDAAHVATFERALGGLYDAADRVAKAKGWQLDHVAEATRVLRVPGTHNYKLRRVVPVDTLAPVSQVSGD